MDNEINIVVRELLSLKGKTDKESLDRYKKLQNDCITCIMPLINNITAKYKSFSNYSDLQQDALEAMIDSLSSFDPTKGDFTWWATKYIQTRVSRSANKHSCIKIPLKKAKKLRPYKVSELPLILDESKSQFDSILDLERSELIEKAISVLSDDQKEMVKMYYGMSGHNEASISEIVSKLKITRSAFFKKFSSAQRILKNKLFNIQGNT